MDSQIKRAPKGWLGDKYIEEEASPKKPVEYRHEVLIRRLGDIKIPVDVLIAFEDGSERHETWDGQYRWKRFLYEGPAKLARVVVDPEFKLVIDVNRTNNSQTLKPNSIAPIKWTSHWLLWVQHALEVLRIFGN